MSIKLFSHVHGKLRPVGYFLNWLVCEIFFLLIGCLVDGLAFQSFTINVKRFSRLVDTSSLLIG
jgi:hypothetical protein